MHPLDGIREKLTRGEEHLETLDFEITQLFAQPNPPGSSIRAKVDQEDSSWVITIVETDPLPIRLGVLVGDVLHNFRSALDQLVFELAFMDTGGTEIETTQFPASRCLANFNGLRVQQRLLSGLTTRHRATIKRFQPYRGWDGDGPHPLALLDDLSNDDKHRVVQPALICPNEITASFPPPSGWHDCSVDRTRPVTGRNIVGRPLDIETEFLRVPILITGPEPNVEMEYKGSISVGFRNGVSVLDALESIAEYARRVVTALEPEFERPKAFRLRDKPRRGRIFAPDAVPARFMLSARL